MALVSQAHGKVAQAPKAPLVYSILPSRARYVIHDLIGQSPTAVVVSDRYAGYAHIDPGQRQVCWAECGRQVS